MEQYDNVTKQVSGQPWPDVAETCLLTMFCHAAESQQNDAILNDRWAVEIARQLAPDIAASSSNMLHSLAKGKTNSTARVHLALRARQYDQFGRDFLARNPGGSIVNIGCGMDSRYFRLGVEMRGSFFDLDLPEVIDFKRRFFQEDAHYRMIGASVLDFKWMDQAAAEADGPTLFMAEGVFPYLEEGDVRRLITTLCSRFPGSELVCEVINKRWISGFWKALTERKMQRSAGIGRGAMFHFGLRDCREMESWDRRISFLGDWSYLDSGHEKLGALRLLGKSRLFRYTQYTVHYRFNR